jgi:hypothetical protein
VVERIDPGITHIGVVAQIESRIEQNTVAAEGDGAIRELQVLDWAAAISKAMGVIGWPY